MKIQLDQNEIELAIKAYINEQVAIKPGQKIELAFTAGRGERGLTVDVDISAADQSVAQITAAQAAPAIEREKPKAAAPVERVNGKVVAQTVAKPSQDDGIANAGDDVGLDEPASAAAPFAKDEEEAEPAADAGRAGKSIFGTL